MFISMVMVMVMVIKSYFSLVKVTFENIIEVKGVVDSILHFFIGHKSFFG